MHKVVRKKTRANSEDGGVPVATPNRAEVGIASQKFECIGKGLIRSVTFMACPRCRFTRLDGGRPWQTKLPVPLLAPKGPFSMGAARKRGKAQVIDK